jgi:hypothetical protein
MKTCNTRTFYFTFFKSLNSDGHQFDRYQHNEQPPLILSELTEHEKDQAI